MAYNDRNVVMENVRITFRNFKGAEGQYNREGDRNFAVLIDDEKVAQAMSEDGWNVKWLKPRTADEEPQAYLSITVNFKGRPPKVVLITGGGRTYLDEEDVEMLDWVDIRTVDLIVRPYDWAVNGKSGISAYLKSIFVTVDEDQLDEKYRDLDQLPSRGGRTYE
jgi:hypothetical protein